jgi:hypothetical protein
MAEKDKPFPAQIGRTTLGKMLPGGSQKKKIAVSITLTGVGHTVNISAKNRDIPSGSSLSFIYLL